MKTKQADLIHRLTDYQLKQQLLLSQFFLFALSLLLSLFLFEKFSVWFTLVEWSFTELFYYGVVPGVIVVVIDLLLMYSLPKKLYDDGGINEKIFKNRSVPDIFVISLIVALSEEMLFRGVIHTVFGYFIASFLFAIVHIRYLTKPVLLISIVLVSFYLGYMYEITSNLLVTIIAHFIIDFFLALTIRLQK
ncbi:CPBP family intramembrane glutamic endopeptidase [Aquibacillus saliphilus]|uniref:CPBP family intramembrane glutamic endopeptidase n=1 Tax=Aquibacillus saliphilus TaxID=1909422 RepID=UPI0034E1DFE2